MESSSVVAFRAIVMLACLVLVPLAAILGSNFPEIVKTEVDRAMTWVKTISTTKPKTKKVRRPAAGDAAKRQSSAAPTSESQFSRQAAPGASKRAGYEAPIDANLRSSGSPVVPASGAQRSADFSSSGTGPIPPEPNRLRALPPPSPNACGDFSALEAELKRQGAVYYLLESWGENRQQYRFHCRVALSRNATSVKQFEAVDDNPLTAMRKVVEQVTAYHSQHE
jgi:hypothetical protein